MRIILMDMCKDTLRRLHSRILPSTTVVVAILLGVWLNLPVFGAFHLEAYSMTMLAMGTDLSRGGQAAMYARDPTMQLVTQYLYLTRPLCTWMLAGAVRLFGPDAAWPVVMALGWMTTILGCTAFARARGVGMVWSLSALLLCQGITSAASSWNETLLWAGWVSLAAALVPVSGRKIFDWRYAAAGACIAVAFMMRQDGLLGAVLLGGLIAGSSLNLRQCLHACALAFAGFMLGLAILCAAMDVDVLLIFSVAHLFTNLRQQAGAVFYPWTALFAIGLPLAFCLPFCMIGRQKRNEEQNPASTRARIFLVMAVMVIWLVSVWIASNPRYILPALFPVIALWGGSGIRGFWNYLCRQPKIAFAAASMVLALMFLPPGLKNGSDGPNALLGRAVETVTWLDWERTMHKNTHVMEALMDSLQLNPVPSRTVIITSHYDDDAAIRLETAKRQWMPMPMRPGCPWSTIYSDGHGRELLHARTVAFYGILGRGTQFNAMVASASLDCPEFLKTAEIILTTTAAVPYYSDPSMWGNGLSKWMLDDFHTRIRSITHEEFERLTLLMTHLAAQAKTPSGIPLTKEMLFSTYKRIE